MGTTSREDLEVLAGRDNKQRLVLYTDRETWIAAESGHSMSGVVGPGRELSAAEVPALLVHGSYAEHTNSSYRHGLQARRAIHLLEIGSRHGRWRADLETAVFVRAQAAAAKGTRFFIYHQQCIFGATGDCCSLCGANPALALWARALAHNQDGGFGG